MSMSPTCVFQMVGLVSETLQPNRWMVAAAAEAGPLMHAHGFRSLATLTAALLSVRSMQALGTQRSHSAVQKKRTGWM